MMRFCTKKGDVVSQWYDYPRPVDEFIEMHGSSIAKDCVWCFVDEEFVYIYDKSGLTKRHDLPNWAPEESYPEYDA